MRFLVVVPQPLAGRLIEELGLFLWQVLDSFEGLGEAAISAGDRLRLFSFVRHWGSHNTSTLIGARKTRA